MDEEIEDLLNLYDLEELLERLDITPFEVLQVLHKHGYIDIPNYVRRNEQEDEIEES